MASRALESQEFDLLPLKTFQHCTKDTDIVCFQVPVVCPLCGKCTATTECRIPPYVLPSSFTTSRKSLRAIVLKPTHGDFIRNYVQTCHLHIGVSDAKGFVYNFDERGLNHDAPWEECLAVSLMENCPVESWDEALAVVLRDDGRLWRRETYHEDDWNCFDFVLSFVKRLSCFQPRLSHYISSLDKAEFSDNFLTQKTQRAEQYIHLYRQTLTQGYVLIKK